MRRKPIWLFEPRVVSPEERERRDHKPRLPKVDVQRDRGCVFFMAFIYAPGGVQIFTGDLGWISEAAKNLPTSHGWLVPYRDGKQIWPGQSYLFGKYTHQPYGVYPSIYMSREGTCKRPGEKVLKHSRYVISVRTNRDESHVIARMRKLPKQRLHIFKDVVDLFKE